MLTLQRITYGYRRDSLLLQDVTLSFERGAIYGIYGESGIGKTTLARLLAGQVLPLEGQVLLDGEVLPRIPLVVQYVGQNPEEAFNPKWRLRKVQQEVSLSLDLMQALNIEASWFNRYPQELSGGQLQRLALARALAVKPSYLIVDEITAMLDSVTQAHIWQSLLTYAQHTKMTLIVISHDSALLEKIGAIIIKMCDII